MATMPLPIDMCQGDGIFDACLTMMGAAIGMLTKGRLANIRKLTAMVA